MFFPFILIEAHAQDGSRAISDKTYHTVKIPVNLDNPTGKAHCEDIELPSSHFSPLRDQDGHGLCWAFAASTLLEEENCKRDPKQCGQALSPIDASRCTWSLEKKEGIFNQAEADESGDPDKALSCGLDHGVCSEELAPIEGMKDVTCSWQQIIKLQMEGPKCFTGKLAKYYEKYSMFRGMLGTCKASSANKTVPDYITRLTKDLQKNFQDLAPKQAALGVDVVKNLREAKNASDFLKSVLITPKCEANRALTNKKSVTVVHLGEKEHQGKYWDAIQDGLRHQRSVAIGVCMGKIKSPSFPPWLVTTTQAIAFLDDRIAKPISHPYWDEFNCAGHALVVTGMRWNKDKNKCELKLRNSWGKTDMLNDWETADNLLHGMVDVSYIKDSK